MAWTTPLTAVAGTAFTAAQFNASVRDNLLETAPAKATTAGRYFAASAANTIAERIVTQGFTSASETTANTSFTDLITVGPTATATFSANVLVTLYCSLTNSIGSASLMSYAISGANTYAADDVRSMALRNSGTERVSCTIIHTGFTAGSSTFVGKYRVNGGTGTWDDRRIGLLPF